MMHGQNGHFAATQRTITRRVKISRIAGHLLVTHHKMQWLQAFGSAAMIFVGCVLGLVSGVLIPAPAAAQSTLCTGISPTVGLSTTTPLQLSHPEFEAKGWLVMLRTGPSMDCESDPIWADDNLRVEQRGTYVGADQSWSLLRFSHNGTTKDRWAETAFVEVASGSGGCSGATPSTTFSQARNRTISHPEFEALGWLVMLRTGPSMDCDADAIWADDNLPVRELGTFTGADQSWSLLQFNYNGSTTRRWAETQFLEGAGGTAGCSGATPSTTFSSPRSRTLSHPEFEAKGWLVKLRTGPSMDCESEFVWADDNLQVEELGRFAGVDQSWSLLRFNHNGASKRRWAETKFLEVAGGSGGCSGATPSTMFSPPRSRTLSHPEFEARSWLVMLREGPSMDCEADPIWASDNQPVEELGTYAGADQLWSLLRFNHNGVTKQRWAETKFLEEPGGTGPTGPTTPTPIGPLPNGVPIVIYDSDMGPDIDDALGLAALHAYANQGMAHIAAVTLSRNSDTGARYIDLLNTFYARPNIPIGVYRGTTSKDTAEHGYTRDILNSGKYPYSLDMNRVPQGHLLMRDVLQASPDNSVVIIQVGFSTNTARLLEEYPDLVARKARLLSVMAGDFSMPSGAAGSLGEFNIKVHQSSARIVFARWPTELVVSEVNLGASVLYPLSSIQNDFNYVTNHPIKDSYLNSTYDWHQENGNSYDMRSWDITSVVAAIQPNVIPRVLGPGKVTVSTSNHTSFSRDNGLHYVLAEGAQLSGAQRQQLVDLMIQLTSEPPAGGSTSSPPTTGDPAPIPSPPRNLDVFIAENPFLCNGTLRTIAEVSGFNNGESVAVTVNGNEYPPRNASSGTRKIDWRCSNGGSNLRFIARGESSGLQTEFTVATNAGVTTPTNPSPPEPNFPDCEPGLPCPDTPPIDFPDCEPGLPCPEPDTVSLTDSAQALLRLFEEEIERSPIDAQVDDDLFVHCALEAQSSLIPPSELDVSSGMNCVISIWKYTRSREWIDRIIDELIRVFIPALEQATNDLLEHPVVEVLGISDIVRCADDQGDKYCVYAAAGVIPVPVGKVPKLMRLLRNTRVPNRLVTGMQRFSDEAASFARLCRIVGVNSFHGDTLVSTASGLLPISDIEIGHLVWAYNEATGEQSLQKVEHLISGEGEKKLIDIMLSNGETITSTAGHPFFLPENEQWLDAGELSSGQSLLGKNGALMEIKALSRRTRSVSVYNLTVANDHTYYAGASEVLNHNAGTCKFPRWTTKSTNHLRGEFNESGRFVGYHSRFGGTDKPLVRIKEKVFKPGRSDIYQANVQVFKDGQWVYKNNKISTFFPDGWDLSRIQKEAQKVYATARLNGQTGAIVTEKSSVGFKILVQVDSADEVIRAHPVF